MALLYNLARVTTATTGTGTITLGAAVPGFLTFAQAGVATGQIVAYGIKSGNNSEVGTGLYTAAGTTLTRNVTKSTNADAAISLAGTSEVYITARAQDIGPPIIISDTMPTGVADGSLWWKSDTGLLYLRFNDGTSTQWVIAAPQPDMAAYLTTSAQTFTAAQQQQVRQNVYAAPFDALAYSGMQINGGMEVSQENGATQVSTTNGYKFIVDGWTIQTSGPQTMYGQQIVTPPPIGFLNALEAAANPACPSPAAGNYCFLMSNLEGFRIARLAWGTANAQPLTIAFWVYATRAGTYSGAIANSAANRSYAFPFTISAATTWEYKTVTIPGDTTGAWGVGNGAGIAVKITLMTGSTYTTAANTWTAGNFLGVTGTANAISATNDRMWLTGFVALPGIQGPTATQSAFVMRPYDQELVTCQRYWRKTVMASGIAYGTTTMRLHVAQTNMRIANPVISTTAPLQTTDVFAANQTQSAINAALFSYGTDLVVYDFGNFSGLTAGRTYYVLPTSPPLQLDARL